VPWNSPEEQRERCHPSSYKDRNPNGATNQQFSNIGFADAQGAEWRGFALSKKDEDGIEFVLM
jgi:hypothetical protein